MITDTAQISGTAQQKLGPTKDANDNNVRVNSLIVANDDTTSIGIDVYLAVDGTGASVNTYIVKGLKLGVGYSADIFAGTTFGYPSNHEIYVKCTDPAYIADVIMSYTTIEKI